MNEGIMECMNSIPENQKVRIIDVGPTYKGLCELMGAVPLRDIRALKDAEINPFAVALKVSKHD